MMDILTAFGLSASAGLNAYIPLLIIALAVRFTDWIQLRYPYDLIGSWWAIGALVLLLVVEVLADKIAVVDHVNDVVAMFIRPTAGALLFAASTGTVQSLDPTLALILGFVVAGTVHGAKATARPMVTASTAGVGNPIVSTLEDIAALLTSVAAVVAPVLIGVAMVVLAILFLWWLTRRGRAPVGADST